MNERVVTFGANNNLVGILTQPETSTPSERRPIVVILNAGILHHVGPFRLHVQLARTLAERGFSSLRMDISGIGDSPQVISANYNDQSVVTDVRAGLDQLQKAFGATDFVVVGLCTGAANSHKVMVADPRVRGAVFLDGYAYPTPRFFILRYGAKLRNPLRLLKSSFTQLHRYLTHRGVNQKALGAADFGWWVLPAKKEMFSDLRTFTDRQNRLLYIHSGDRREFYNYIDQMREAFSTIDFGDRLSVIINSHADHTYSTCIEREKLLEQISNWLDSWVPQRA